MPLISSWQKTHMMLSQNESDWDCHALDGRMNPISAMNISLSVPDYSQKCNVRFCHEYPVCHTKKIGFLIIQQAISTGNILFEQLIESCPLNDEWVSPGSKGMYPWWTVNKDLVWMMKERVTVSWLTFNLQWPPIICIHNLHWKTYDFFCIIFMQCLTHFCISVILRVLLDKTLIAFILNIFVEIII